MTETYKIRRTKLINISFVLLGYLPWELLAFLCVPAQFSRFHVHQRRFIPGVLACKSGVLRCPKGRMNRN